MTQTEQQRTPEWFEQRKGMVTASMAGAILGMSPHMTRKDAMKSILGLSEFKGNVATEYGNFHEDDAIVDFTMETGITVEKTGFHINPTLRWLGASPDGFTSDGFGIEIKCPYGKRNDVVPVFKTCREQEHYYAQVQINMSCTGRKSWYFYQWSPTATKLEVVPIDLKWLDENLPHLFAFYNEYLECKDRDIGRELVSEYDEKKLRQKQDEERCKEILAELAEMTGGEGGRIYDDRFLSKVTKQGAISYSNVVKDHAAEVDLEPYRGKPSTYWVLK